MNSLYLLDNEITKQADNDKVAIYSYLKTIFNEHSNKYLQTAMSVLAYKLPIFSILYAVYDYAYNYSFNLFQAKLSQKMEDILFFVTNQGDVYDAVKKFDFENISELNNFLYSGTGMQSLDKIIRKYIILSEQSKEKDTFILKESVAVCSSIYKDFIENKVISEEEQKYSDVIIKGYVRYLCYMEDKTYQESEEIKKIITNMDNKLNFDDEFFKSIYVPLSKKEKFDIVYQIYSAIKYFTKKEGV